MPEQEDGRGGRPRSAWERPPVERREDQRREWEEVAAASLTHPALRALHAAWERAARAEGARPPSRLAFRPTDVVEALGRVTVLERVAAPGAAATWRYRLVGTQVADMVQEDFTGRTIDYFHEPLAAMLRAQIGRAAETGAPAAFRVRTVVDHRPYAYERLVLPVRSAPEAETDQMMLASIPAEGV